MADSMISAQAVTRRFDNVDALRGIDLDIARGEMFGLIGPDGAGKTTFFRIIAGLLKPTSGTLTRDQRGTFGLVPQRFGLYQDLSIDENLALRARLYDVPRDTAQTRATELLELVGLSPFRQRLAGALSGGMKQKLALASALLTRPDLLLLDEPTTGVDPLSRREFWKLLHHLHHEGLTIVVSTPYMDEAEYASRIGFLDRGRLSALGTRQAIVASYPRQLVDVSALTPTDIARGAQSAPDAKPTSNASPPAPDDVGRDAKSTDDTKATSDANRRASDEVRRAKEASSEANATGDAHTPERLKVRERLAPMPDVDDVSLFGTSLHVRGAEGAAPGLVDRVRQALAGVIDADRIRPIPPSLEDVFVLQSEAHEEAA